MLDEMEVEVKKTLVLQINNKSTINFTKNQVLHERSKHIEARFHFLKKKVNHSELEVSYCSSEAQLADIFTKMIEDRQVVDIEKEIRNSSNQL